MNPSIRSSTTPLPPSYPARPINGGPLPKAQPKHGRWYYEPKLNGWRAWVHPRTGRMFNRENQPLSITTEFTPVLERLQVHARHLPEWLDVEALSRRVPVGKGSLILLDALIPGTYVERQDCLYRIFDERGLGLSWAFEQFPPPANELLRLAYCYEDIASEIAGGAVIVDPDNDPAAAWERLQQVNRALKCELFEGLVAKRADSLYPLQLRSPDVEFPFWMKHRWRW